MLCWRKQSITETGPKPVAEVRRIDDPKLKSTSVFCSGFFSD